MPARRANRKPISANSIRRKSFGSLVRVVKSKRVYSRTKKFAIGLIGLMHTPKGIRLLKNILLDKRQPIQQRESAGAALAEIAKFENGQKAENYLEIAFQHEEPLSRVYNFLHILLQDVKEAKAKRGMRGYMSHQEMRKYWENLTEQGGADALIQMREGKKY